MSIKVSKYCPGTLAEGHTTYSNLCLKRVFNGKRVNHVLPYNSPMHNSKTEGLFDENRQRISISGVQAKFSVVLEKNKLRLVNANERGTYILKPIPRGVKNADQMPANEHLTMQIARQVYGIETAENALIFFKDGTPAYITKRFDVKADGSKWAQDDFASLAGRTAPTHGEHYKYLGSYFDLFELMKLHLPAYKIEAPKLFKLLLFNYLFSNGDAHFKNFSLLETPLGDYRLSPAYDLLNTRLHIADRDFALDHGLLPPTKKNGSILHQFKTLGQLAGMSPKQIEGALNTITNGTERASILVKTSYLNDKAMRNYWQSYQGKIKKLMG